MRQMAGMMRRCRSWKASRRAARAFLNLKLAEGEQGSAG